MEVIKLATQTGDRVNFVSVESELPQTLADDTLYFVKPQQQLWLGSNLIASAINYSTEEHVIGKWFDETLYERSYRVNFVVPRGGTWFDTQIDISDIDYLVNTTCSQSSGAWSIISGINNNQVLNLINFSSGDLTVDTVTIQYTKPVAP